MIAIDPLHVKEYLPMIGHHGFIRASQEIIFGKGHPIVDKGQVATIQTVSGCGSIRMGLTFIKKFLEGTVYVSDPTWITHHAICKEIGLKIEEYPYWDTTTKSLNYQGMKEKIKSLSSGSIVILQPFGHNPTGIVPDREQWKELARIMKEKRIIPYFDCAYHGFTSGIEDERNVVLDFAGLEIPMFVSYSFSKNFGIYGERLGALHIVNDKEETSKKILSQLTLIIRNMYSTPPMNGALLVDKIWHNDSLRKKWED